MIFIGLCSPSSQFTSDIIKNFKKINTPHLTSKELLEVAVQEITIGGTKNASQV